MATLGRKRITRTKMTRKASIENKAATPSQTRKFGKETFKLAAMTDSKRMADRATNEIRGRGYSVRVVSINPPLPVNGGRRTAKWAIYIS